MPPMPEGALPAVDWDLLAYALERDWEEMDAELHRYHKGVLEAYLVVARAMRDAEAPEREGALYRLLADSLRGEQAGMVG